MIKQLLNIYCTYFIEQWNTEILCSRLQHRPRCGWW